MQWIPLYITRGTYFLCVLMTHRACVSVGMFSQNKETVEPCYYAFLFSPLLFIKSYGSYFLEKSIWYHMEWLRVELSVNMIYKRGPLMITWYAFMFLILCPWLHDLYLPIRPFKINCVFWVKIFSSRNKWVKKKKLTRWKKKKTFLWKKCIFYIFDRILFEDRRFFISDESSCSCHRKPKSNIFPLNTLWCFLFWHWKRNEQEDSKRAIYFERPNIV